MRFFSLFLKVGPFYRLGNQNARNVVVNYYEFIFKNLPPIFDGYRIIQLTDLHFDCIPGIEKILVEKLSDLKYDFCVITGDYREQTHGGYKQILQPMKETIDSIKNNDGIVAILGNHDTYLMVDDFEKMGIRVLVNETIRINRKGDYINITGVDDPSTYYTDSALIAMEQDVAGFKVLLAHSPELYDLAQKNNYHLYLTGHTHGGQICLPGGVAIVTHLKNGKKYYKGVWHVNGMTGLTNQGCGASGIPVRFNTQSEIAHITLRCNKK